MRSQDPLVLLGHSLGGAVVGRFVAEGIEREPAPWHRPVDPPVLTSPARDLGMSPTQKRFARRPAAGAADAPLDVVRTRELPACYHEILNEPEQVGILKEIRRWLDHRGL